MSKRRYNPPGILAWSRVELGFLYNRTEWRAGA
jgi:hypothetical protein